MLEVTFARGTVLYYLVNYDICTNQKGFWHQGHCFIRDTKPSYGSFDDRQIYCKSKGHSFGSVGHLATLINGKRAYGELFQFYDLLQQTVDTVVGLRYNQNESAFNWVLLSTSDNFYYNVYDLVPDWSKG